MGAITVPAWDDFPENSDKSESRGSRRHYAGGELTAEAVAILLLARQKRIPQRDILDATVRVWGLDNVPSLKTTKSIERISLKTLYALLSDKNMSDMQKWFPEQIAAIA